MRIRKLLFGLISTLALGGILSGTTVARAATDTADLAVSATVSANCTISTTALGFGTYDPVSVNAATPLDVNGGVTVTCTSGSNGTVTLGQGLNADTGSTEAVPLRRMILGTDYINYDLFSDTERTTVWADTALTGVVHAGTGTATAITIYGQVPAGQNVPAGTYADTVVATVTF